MCQSSSKNTVYKDKKRAVREPSQKHFLQDGIGLCRLQQQLMVSYCKVRQLVLVLFLAVVIICDICGPVAICMTNSYYNQFLCELLNFHEDE